MADKSEFLKTFKARAGKNWKDARKAKGESSLTAPTGIYAARLRSVTFDLDKNKNPFFTFRLYLMSEDEDINGQPAFKTHFLSPQSRDPKTKKPYGLTEKEKLENLKKDFDRVAPGNNLSEDDSDITDMVTLAEELSESRPTVRIKIQRDEGGTNRDGSKRAPETYQPTIYINGLVPDNEVPEVDEPEDEAPEDDEDAGDDSGDEDVDGDAVDEDGGDDGEGAEDGDDSDNGDDDGSDEGSDENAGDEGESGDDDEPPQDYEETPRRSAKKPASTGKPSAKTGTTKPTSKVKFTKGDTVMYASRAGGKVIPHKVLAVSAAGYLKLKNEKTGTIIPDVDPKGVKKA